MLIWNVFLLLSCSISVKSDSTLRNCQDIKELLAQNGCDIWKLSDCNGTRTQSHLFRKRALVHFAKLAK